MDNDILRAKKVVGDIANRNGVFTEEQRIKAGSELMSCVDNLKNIAANATKKLAQDLYSKDTHFILECIQNADDNAYAPEVVPKLRFRLHPKSIEIDCNEVGFQDNHVRALCSVGNSTKVNATGRQEGYIGEKGIGFKSVFKVAQRVQIHSPPYSFDLDQARDLGMITPCWVPEILPSSETRDDCQTQITLFPSSGETFGKLAKYFQDVDPTLLVFLRKLKCIQVTIDQLPGRSPSSCSYSTTWAAEGSFVTVLTRHLSFDSPPLELVSSKKRYHVFKSTCEDLPPEPLRQDIETAEVVLAFPVNGASEPLDEEQSVHAFLPVRGYGFRFLIQADFLITSNRQDVNEGSAWNKRLRDFVVQVFTQAPARFRLVPDLRYTWLRYLPQNISNEFWTKLETDLIDDIKGSPIVETRTGTYALPRKIEILHKTLLDRDGKPLVGEDETYASQGYSDRDLAILERLGMTTFDCYNLLETIIQWSEVEFARRPLSWHEDLATVINATSDRLRVTAMDSLGMTSIIPLDDGTWTEPPGSWQDPIYFKESSAFPEIPSDLQLRLVDPSASRSKARRSLFESLNVKDCEAEEVTKLIFDAHRSQRAPSLEDAVAHAHFIFSQGAAKEDNRSRQLWLYDAWGVAAKGADLYFAFDDGKHSPKQLFTNEPCDGYQARFLHSKYSRAVHTRDQLRWTNWLRDWLGVARVPRLAKDGSMTPDFEFIMEKWPDHVLDLLRWNWNAYEPLLNSDIRGTIGSHKVLCSDGEELSRMCLRQAFAPEQQLRKLASQLCDPYMVPFLQMKDYNRMDWKFLKSFGVGFDEGLSFYLWLLQHPSFINGSDLKRAKMLYGQISSSAEIDWPRIKSAFDSGKTIYLSGSAWTKVGKCVWDMPKGFAARHGLKSLYETDVGAARLMCEVLDIRSASLASVMKDLKARLSRTESVDCRPVYEYISKTLADILYKPAGATAGAEEYDRQRSIVRDGFMVDPLLRTSPGASSHRVSIADCVWDSPIELSLHQKVVLKPFYGEGGFMSNFLQCELGIPDASIDEVLEQLSLLKQEQRCSLSTAISVYAYLSTFGDGVRQKLRDSFEQTAYILVPGSSEDDTVQWLKLSQCVWTASSALRHVTPIADVYAKDTFTQHLLQKVLSVCDADIYHLIKELRFLQRRFGDTVPFEWVEQLYDDIQRRVRDGQYSISDLSKAFRKKPIVFTPWRSESRWRTLNDCIWKGAKGISSKEALVPRYQCYEQLFRDTLRLKNCSSKMLVEEIVAVSQSEDRALVDKIRDVIDMLLSLSGRVIENVDPLRKATCWPCRPQKGGFTTCVSLKDNFFVADRTDLLDAFDRRIPILDVTVDEARRLRPLMGDLHMKDRLLSLVSMERSTPRAPRSDAPSTQYIQERADALVRCANHYRYGMDLESIAQVRHMLSSATVFIAEHITTTYTLESRGYQIIADGKGYMVLEADDDSLQLYFPSDEADRKLAATFYLPKQLIAVLQLPEEKAWQAVTSVLGLHSGQIEVVLDRLGIRQVFDETAVEGSNSPKQKLIEFPTETAAEATQSASRNNSTSSSVAMTTPIRSRPHQERPGSAQNMNEITNDGDTTGGRTAGEILRTASSLPTSNPIDQLGASDSARQESHVSALPTKPSVFGGSFTFPANDGGHVVGGLFGASAQSTFTFDGKSTSATSSDFFSTSSKSAGKASSKPSTSSASVGPSEAQAAAASGSGSTTSASTSIFGNNASPSSAGLFGGSFNPAGGNVGSTAVPFSAKSFGDVIDFTREDFRDKLQPPTSGGAWTFGSTPPPASRKSASPSSTLKGKQVSTASSGQFGSPVDFTRKDAGSHASPSGSNLFGGLSKSTEGNARSSNSTQQLMSSPLPINMKKSTSLLSQKALPTLSGLFKPAETDGSNTATSPPRGLFGSSTSPTGEDSSSRAKLSVRSSSSKSASFNGFPSSSSNGTAGVESSPSRSAPGSGRSAKAADRASRASIGSVDNSPSSARGGSVKASSSEGRSGFGGSAARSEGFGGSQGFGGFGGSAKSEGFGGFGGFGNRAKSEGRSGFGG
ncbi:MAG: hypothetical protein M1817_005234 [Caeruleum heppii]|nr:MAG: hypothetical protein M1817_005234 [Caeruleum heppii]